jgi:DEAD/DEAH box helicase domain-containing protein
VPGGTGYLHQLLAHDAGTLSEVLKLALEALSTCSCNQDPEKDGCYRCLYQYRLGRNMEQVSREMAKSVLGELVGSLDQLERVDTISDIFINPNFDSVLEARFIESLKRLGGVGGIPMVKLVQDIVNGKSGYVLEVGKQRYRVEPQCELGADQGVAFPSKPDFVIWPWSVTSKRKPIAVFCDGWAYHKDTLREDARKRSAIVAGGRMWVWSVTHNDVMSALAGSLDSDLDSPLVAMSRHNGTIAPPSVPRAQEKAFTQHQVARLLQWLAMGADAQGHDAGLEQMRRNALWLGFLMIPSTADDKAACAHQMGQWLPRLPDAIREPGKGFAPCASKPNGVSSLTGWWPLSMTKGVIPTEGWTSPGVVALDVAAAESETELHLAWRRWLQLFNAMQCLPGMLLATTNGLDGHDYDALAIDGSSHGGAPAQVADQAALHQAWSEVLGQVLSELKAGLTTLAHAGAPTPEVGLELADERGRVLADAEMAWPHAKVAVLRPDQEDMTQSWLDAGWKVMLLDESLTMVSGQAWPLVIAPLLGLELKNEE